MAGRLREAAEVLQGTASKNPKFAQPLLAGGRVRPGEEDAGGRGTSRACDQPRHLEALRGLGDLGLMDGDLGMAESHYGRILEVDPKDAGP
jgi:hypothetical protein